MTRTLRTLLLSATALGALATAAAASPPALTSTAGMAGMHATMMADTAIHESMMDDASMRADCPMLGGGSMATMHGGGGHLDHHRATPRGGDRR